MRRRKIGFALLLLSCGGASSTVVDAGTSPRDAQADGGSTADAATDASTPEEGGAAGLVCDETGDCAAGVCCAESDPSSAGKIVTSCRDTCVTGLPRYKVCKSASECESQSCVAYACGSAAPPLRYCEKPDFCP